MVTEEEQSDMELASEMVPVPQLPVQNETCTNQSDNQEVKIPRRKPRSRKKELHASILKQMEFYFSDANLSKDRFLSNLIKQDPCVDIQVFLSFNRIRTLTLNPTRIAKALRSSTMLAVSEDGTKVFRVTPIMERENVEECTIYVQRLPPHADHDMLSSIFSQYGPIAYISIPTYKINKKSKGFAFVEFETPEIAEKCMKAFRAKGCELPSQTSPTNVLSITTYSENTEETKDNEICGNDKNKSISNLNKKARKRSVPLSDSEKEYQPPIKSKKKRKKSIEPSEIDSTNINQKTTETVLENDDKDEKGSDDSTTQNDEKQIHQESNDKECENMRENRKMQKSAKNELLCSVEDIGEEAGNSKLRQGKRKSKLKENFVDQVKKKKVEITIDSEIASKDNRDLTTETNMGEIENGDQEYKEEKGMSPTTTTDEIKKKKKRKRYRKNEEKIDATDMGFQVMTKKDWRRLRNKYLELQKSKMKQLKQHLRKARWNQWNNSEKCKTEKEESYNEQKIVALKQPAEIRNFSFVPGVIVKLEMDELCTDPKEFKAELKGNTGIKYIDVSEGSNTAFLRFESPEVAEEFVQKPLVNRKMSIIKDEEEKSYWNKMKKDRKEKVEKKVRVKQRGRNKLMKKAEKELGKHIKFD